MVDELSQLMLEHEEMLEKARVGAAEGTISKDGTRKKVGGKWVKNVMQSGAHKKVAEHESFEGKKKREAFETRVKNTKDKSEKVENFDHTKAANDHAQSMFDAEQSGNDEEKKFHAEMLKHHLKKLQPDTEGKGENSGKEQLHSKLSKLEGMAYDTGGDSDSNPHEQKLNKMISKYTDKEPGDFSGEGGMEELTKHLQSNGNAEKVSKEINEHFKKHKVS
jgi:hypothetical protein